MSRLTFETKEKEVLFAILANPKYAFIKSRDNSSDARTKKEQMWAEVNVKFKDSPLTRKTFSIEQLKTCYKNEARKTKQVVANNRKETLQTGGGQSQAQPLDALQQSVLFMLGQEINPLDCPNDSDAGTFDQEQLQATNEFSQVVIPLSPLRRRVEEAEAALENTQNQQQIEDNVSENHEPQLLEKESSRSIPVRNAKRKRTEVFEDVANEQFELIQLRKKLILEEIQTQKISQEAFEAQKRAAIVQKKYYATKLKQIQKDSKKCAK